MRVLCVLLGLLLAAASERAEGEQIAATLLGMVKNRIPAMFRFDPIRDIQVLCPMNRGFLGIRELND